MSLLFVYLFIVLVFDWEKLSETEIFYVKRMIAKKKDIFETNNRWNE